MLRIAVQAKGRLFDETMSFLEESDIKLSATKRTLLVQSSNFSLEVLFLRDDDIPQTVATELPIWVLSVKTSSWKKGGRCRDCKTFGDSANAVCHWPYLKILNIRVRSGLRVRRLPLRIRHSFPVSQRTGSESGNTRDYRFGRGFSGYRSGRCDF